MNRTCLVMRAAMLGLIAAPALCAGPLWAQGAGNAAAAEALFVEGRRLMDEGRYAEACPKLAASNKLDPGAGTLLNLAACYEKNGQTASAWVSYREAASEARKSGRSEWEEKAREKAAALEPSLSRLTIKVPPAARVPGLIVERDGTPVDQAQWDTAIPVDPGVHPVVATAPRKQQWSTSASVGPNGAMVEITIPTLLIEQGGDAPLPAALPADRHAADASGDVTTDGASQRTIGMVLAGVGAVTIGVGTVFGLAAKSRHDEAMAHCNASNQCSPQGLALDDQARSKATTATIAFGAGVTVLTGGLVVWLTAPSGSKTASAPPAWSVAVATASDGAAASVSGVF